MAIAEIAACITMIKGLNDAISTAKEAKDNASAFAGIINKFAKANDAVMDVESKHVGRLSVEDSMKIQLAKRQLSTFNQQLKDVMLMQGLSGDYNEIMNRVEESRLAHEKKIKRLKLQRKQRAKDIQLILKIVGIAFCVLGILVLVAGGFKLAA